MTNPLLAAAMWVLVVGTAVAEEGPPASDAARQLIEQLGLVEDTEPVREKPGWAPPKRVAIGHFGSDVEMEAILQAARAVAGDAEVFLFAGDDLEALARADVIIGWCAPAMVAAAPRLRWMHSLRVGVDRCMQSDAIQGRDFILTNNQRGMGPDIAEHVIALLLALSRNLDFYMREQQSRRWTRGGQEAVNVNGKTLLVLGLGGIGTEVARRAHGLGMRVIATRRSSRKGPDFVDYVGLSGETLKLAREADAVANTLPLTDETRGLVDEAFFAALRPGAFYVSVGRGATTDTQALVAALESGRLAGAGVDVVDPEPLPEDHPLWAMRNVIITPHIAGRTDEVRGRTLAISIENLRRYTQGEPLLSVVDFELGY